jgi:hypothetical protein
MKTLAYQIDSLANETLSVIFSYLHDAKTLAYCAETCNRWKVVVSENFVWKMVCAQKSYTPTKKYSLKNARKLFLLGLAPTPWKFIYQANHLTLKNWNKGKYNVSHLTNDAHQGFVCMDFNDQHAFSIKIGHPGIYWNLKTGHASLQLEHPSGSFTSVKLNEKYIAMGFRDGSIRIWEISTGLWKFELFGHSDEVGALFLYDDFIASGSEDSTIRVLKY